VITDGGGIGQAHVHIPKLDNGSMQIDLPLYHCKNKLVVSMTEWLPWLQTNWRDSGYERFALVLRLIAKGNPRGSCPVHLTTTIN